jgi:hypothetical protein
MQKGRWLHAANSEIKTVNTIMLDQLSITINVTIINVSIIIIISRGSNKIKIANLCSCSLQSS